MTGKLLGAALIGAAAVWGFAARQRQLWQRRELVSSLQQALGHMASAIRCQRQPMTPLLTELARRQICGGYFAAILREEGISDEEILQVCRYVNADKFIDKLDHGLDEEVRERGNNFSAGQRQLLSFARTIIHKPSVMILDEATANIDTETELLIQDSLEKMRSVGTMLIVAHRLSTIQHADNIIVLSHGKILEQGNHQELLAKHGRYYQLYTLQYHKEQLEG